jgi:hypothetical protein
MIKPHVRTIQRADGVLTIDDSIVEKEYTDENEIICWHYDHAKEQTVKGINFITTLYTVRRCTRWGRDPSPLPFAWSPRLSTT